LLQQLILLSPIGNRQQQLITDAVSVAPDLSPAGWHWGMQQTMKQKRMCRVTPRMRFLFPPVKMLTPAAVCQPK
jgi:hypothetical protein